jgi:hypothetical protein
MELAGALEARSRLRIVRRGGSGPMAAKKKAKKKKK